MKQDQFLTVIDRDEAERRFRAALDLRPVGTESLQLNEALGRVLAEDVFAPVDVPSFDRSNVDGFAVISADTFGAQEEAERPLRLSGESLAPGVLPRVVLRSGFATPIATGAMIPRGADAVVMVEQTQMRGGEVWIQRPVPPGANVSYAGTDIGRGEVVLRRGQVLRSRETGVLAAIGLNEINVVRRPKVAILSTGNELICPGEAMRPGLVYDSNAVILADAVRELGCEPITLGIFPDDLPRLQIALNQSLEYDAILLSGGTSKGEGDISYRAIAGLGHPGILVHGVALKPGKPLCLGAIRVQRGEREQTLPLAILPGFPTSAIFTFHEFVAPVLRMLAGGREEQQGKVTATLPMRVNSERGRTEYLLVGLVQAHAITEGTPRFIAYPMGKGSGSVTTFSRADGFIAIPRQKEYLDANTIVEVQLLAKDLRPADLVVIGSHCAGLDYLLGLLQAEGLQTKFLAVGSMGGLEAAKRGECDVAGVHLLDPETNEYNRSYMTSGLTLVPGYRRMQGFIFRKGDARFEGRSLEDALRVSVSDADCLMVNRNRGSGTRILIDGLLQGTKPMGYSVEARSHNAVVAAIEQERADWGVAIEFVTRGKPLGFIPMQEECYDFVIPVSRAEEPAVGRFIELLQSPKVLDKLRTMGFAPQGVDPHLPRK